MINHVAKHNDKADPAAEQRPLSELLRLPSGPVELSAIPTDSTVGFPGEGKTDLDTVGGALVPELEDLQERLFANGRATPETAPRVLLVLQGMDTSGKGGVIKHAIGMVDPQGVRIKAFKAPTEEEQGHPFLWRGEGGPPPPRGVGIFPRPPPHDGLAPPGDANTK